MNTACKISLKFYGVVFGHMESFRDANSSYSGYKSAHAHKSTQVMQSRTSRVINKMATSYGN